MQHLFWVVSTTTPAVSGSPSSSLLSFVFWGSGIPECSFIPVQTTLHYYMQYVYSGTLYIYQTVGAEHYAFGEMLNLPQSCRLLISAALGSVCFNKCRGTNWCVNCLISWINILTDIACWSTHAPFNSVIIRTGLSNFITFEHCLLCNSWALTTFAWPFCRLC